MRDDPEGAPHHEVVFAQQAIVHQGPLPPPADLGEYDRIRPDLVDRIVAMAESEMGHRHSMESRRLRSASRRSMAGLIAGFVVAVSVLAGAAWLIDSGHDAAGIILGSVDLVGLVAVFVLGRRNGNDQASAG